MGIKVKHGEPVTMLTAAQLAGQARKQEKLEIMQLDFDYKKALREQDMAIDLEMDSRAKLWAIEKMEISSRIDFQREEQKRQRVIDTSENALLQIDKEIAAGRADKNDPKVQAMQLYHQMKAQYPESSPPMGLIKSAEEDRYGVRPYYTDPEFERDFPELAAAKRKDITEGRAGTVPWDLHPDNISTPMARASREAREMYIEDFMDEGEKAAYETLGIVPPRFQSEVTPLQTEFPLSDKQLDIGVRTEQPEPTTVIEFESTVARLGTVDRERAREYYNKWAGKF